MVMPVVLPVEILLLGATVVAFAPAVFVGLAVFGFVVWCVWPRLFPSDATDPNATEPTELDTWGDD